MRHCALIALGGNALCGADQKGTYAEQRENARAMAASIGELIDAGWRVVVVHGNGPQVGALGVQQEEAAAIVPPQPLSSLCAMTQGYLGSLIALALRERLGPDHEVVSVVTHVVVHEDDPAFAEPSKPIGPFYSESEAHLLAEARQWTVGEDSGRGYRRLVPSPEPLAILEADAIRRMVDAGVVVIACGGGGVPIAMSSDGYVGVDAVIDKDLAAQRLASTLGVDVLALVTTVEAVHLDHGTPHERDVHALHVDDAARHLADGQFAAGSMAPKIAAAIRFLEEGGRAVAITTPALVAATVASPDGAPPGTLVTRRGAGSVPPLSPRVSSTAAHVQRDRYVDSVALMAATRAMLEADGVDFATAVMGTPANIAALHDAGIPEDVLAPATTNDVVLAVRASDGSLATQAIEQGERALAPSGAARPGPAQRAPRSLGAAVDALADANVAIVSVPGPYAALETHKAVAAGLDVLLFSDNVSVEDEIALKEHAARAGRLVMGPGAGTARLGGCGLGFANVVAAGRVGVVAAAGTGAQEAMVLLDRWGEGVSHVIGVGGRDLSAAVAGRGARQAVRALEHDPATDVVLLVSKPPSPDVATAVISARGTKPLVAALVGLAPGTPIAGAARVSSTIEGGVRQVVELRGGHPPSDWSDWRQEVGGSLDGLADTRTAACGLFCGGTLCYETLTLWQPLLGAVWSNTPLDPRYRVPAPDGAHVCLDLGEEEYTKGRPHPMIDAEARLELLAEAGDRDDVATLLLDVVLGDGAHADPASVLVPACAALARPDGPRVVVYVLGTELDPQGLDRQRRAFREAGCLVAPTGARAALAAAAIALRRPDVVEILLS